MPNSIPSCVPLWGFSGGTRLQAEIQRHEGQWLVKAQHLRKPDLLISLLLSGLRGSQSSEYGNQA